MSDFAKQRAWHLIERPTGRPGPQHFRLVTSPRSEPGEGEALVRNIAMSVDPYMRPRMNDVKSYIPPFALDAPLDGAAVGEIVVSRNPALPVGAFVRHFQGWRDYAVIRSGEIIDADRAPLNAYLGVLGVPGLTAFIGIVEVLRAKAGETLYISAATGAVGSIAGQIAKLLGAVAIGSTGSETNVAFLRETLHFDAAFATTDGTIGASLKAAAPNGIHGYFDNVGGEALEAALAALRPFGRVALCGMIAGYNDAVPGPRNLALAVGKRLTLQGFNVIDHADLTANFLDLVAPALADGRIVAPETVIEGLEHAPDALCSLFSRGTKRGKLIVKVG